MSAPTIEFRPWPGEPHYTSLTAAALFIAALSIWALAVMLFAPAAITTLALFAIALLLVSAGLAYQRSDWRMLALLLVVEALPSANLLPITEDQRPLVRYPLYLFFCVPMLPKVWRSGILSHGGFRLYSIYFAWALLSATWSLVPIFSFGRALASTLLFVALCSIALDIADNDALLRVIRYVLAACAILTAIIAVTAFIPGLESAWMFDAELGAYRLQGIFDSPNQVGEVNMIAIGAALASWQSLRTRTYKLGAALLIVVSVLMMVAADSRSAAVAMIVSMAALAIWRFGWRGVFGVMVGVAAGVFVAGQLSPQALLYLTRSDVATLTGRTQVMHFSLHRVMENPLLGYGFGAEGQIFHNRYFPLWEDLWTWGPRIPIHNGYLSRAVGLGVPAALLWAFLFARPFVVLFSRPADPYGLRKPVVLLLVLPVLILYLSETLGGDCRFPAGIVSTLVWAVAEKERLRATGALPARNQSASTPAPVVPRRAMSRLLFLAGFILPITIASARSAHAYRLHVPCTSSHDCPRGAFCRHKTNFRGQCIVPPLMPFGVFERRQIEFPAQPLPFEHAPGSIAVLRCSVKEPCPPGFVCAKYGTSSLKESLCVPSSEPCWSTADCAPEDICDKANDEFSLTGVCRPREEVGE